jgi:hypothetical protein
MKKNHDELEVYPIGTQVVMSSIEGTIVGIQIRNNGYVLYDISYFDKGEKKTQWLESFEFHTESKEKKKIGFL